MNKFPESIKQVLSLNLCKRHETISDIIVTHYYDRVLGFNFKIGNKCFCAIKHIDESRFDRFYRDLWVITESPMLNTSMSDINIVFDSGINFWILYEYTCLVSPRYYKLVFKQVSKPKNKFLTINIL